MIIDGSFNDDCKSCHSASEVSERSFIEKCKVY